MQAPSWSVPFLDHHCSITVPSLHHHCTVTAPAAAATGGSSSSVSTAAVGVNNATYLMHNDTYLFHNDNPYFWEDGTPLTSEALCARVRAQIATEHGNLWNEHDSRQEAVPFDVPRTPIEDETNKHFSSATASDSAPVEAAIPNGSTPKTTPPLHKRPDRFVTLLWRSAASPQKR